MSDTTDTQATEDTQQASAEQTAGDSATQEQTTETQDAGNQEAAEATEASIGDKSTSETKDAKQESKPVSRRSAAYRLQQIMPEYTKLKAQEAARQQQAGQDDEDGENATGDQTPDINKLVAEAVQNALKPVMSEHTKSADDSELNELFSGNRASERSKYEQKIRDMWNLSQYRDVAASDLYKIASFDEAVKTATERAIAEYKEAEKQAKESSASGSSNTSNRSGDHKPPMTDAELLAHNERVKAGIK